MESVFHVKHWRAALAPVRLRVWVGVLVLALLAGSCVVSESPITGRKRAYGYSWEQEAQIGQQADQSIIQQYGLYDDPQLQAYVERVGQKVLAQSHLRRPDADAKYQNTKFTFRVLDSPVINAFALPGGFVYVTRGLLAHMENEAQLAVVVGHEIGHVAARHASQRAFEQQLGQVGLFGGAILGQEVLGLPAGDLLNLGSQAAQLLFLSYSRDDERESDQLGVEYAALAGYEASEGSEFFRSLKRIEQQQGGGLPSFYSTHPDPGEREQRIIQLAQEWEQQGVQMTTLDREQFLSQIDGIVIGTDPRQGFVQDGVFYHPELRFRLPIPSGWQTSNQPTQLVMMEPNQQALIVLSLASAGSPREAAAAFAQQQGVNVIDSGQASANGLQAYYVVADAQMQDGQPVRLLDYFVAYNERVYSVLGLAGRQGFSNYQRTFEQVMKGFATETSSRILSAQPVRLDVQNASRTAAFSTFIPNEIPFDLSPQDLAIMNQVDLNTQIQQGRLIKVPQQ